MISIKRLASALCLAICFSSLSNAQTNADGTETTGNLIGNNQWTGAVYGNDPNDCCSNPGGSQPLYDISTDTIKFSYGQATVGQIIGINNALSGAGIQVNGYTWQYDARNMNGGGGQNGTDTLTSYSYLMDGRGALLASNTITHNTQFEWTTFSGTQTLANPYSISGGGIVGIQFSGRDDGFWAGLYGPEVRNVGLRLNYTSGPDPCTVDPLSSTSCPGYAEAYKSQQCSINPLYDTTCPGYAEAYFAQQCSFNPLYNTACPGNSSVIASGNLVPNPNGNTGYISGYLNNSFAINTALSHSGAGIMVHGFQWGYRAINYNPFWGIAEGSSQVNVNIRNGDGTSLYAWSRRNTTMGENWYSSSYVLPQSINNLNMGNFDFTASSSGFGVVDRMWARALITPDQCTLDPLSNTACTGYQAAFLDQQCSLNALYSPSCPGYNDALKAMLEEQAALAAAATSSSTTTTDPTSTANTGSTGTSSATATGTQDPTKTDATVTTDVGGVELTTTGEIVVADSVPATVKEAAKETTKTQEAAKETTTASSTSTTATEKKTTRVNALAIAQSAARDAEATAKATAESAVAQSQSAAANPSDGTGATINLGGITLDSLRSMTAAGQDLTATAAVNRAAQQTVAVRSLSADSEARASTDDRPVAVTAADPLQDTVNRTVSSANYSLLPQQTDERVEDRSKSTAGTGMRLEQLAVMPVIPEEPKAPTGSSVRRGGAVDGMSGGDMNALAAAPANFNDYLGKQMQDAQFYASKEIYRGQRNVDNARALRGLGTDRLHQQMVDQQYNISGQ